MKLPDCVSQIPVITAKAQQLYEGRWPASPCEKRQARMVAAPRLEARGYKTFADFLSLEAVIGGAAKSAYRLILITI